MSKKIFKVFTLVFCLSVLFSFSAFAKNADANEAVELKNHKAQTEILSNTRASNFKIEAYGAVYFPNDPDNHLIYLKVNITGNVFAYPTATWDGEDLTLRRDKVRPYKDSTGKEIGTTYFFYLPWDYNSEGKHLVEIEAQERINEFYGGGWYILNTSFTY